MVLLVWQPFSLNRSQQDFSKSSRCWSTDDITHSSRSHYVTSGAETAYINGFHPASVPLQSLAVSHMAKVKSSKIVQYVCTISRLCKCIAQSQDCLRNLEIGTQFQDSENAQRNLEIAQIPKLRGTYSPAIFRSANILGIQYRREAVANHVLCGHDARRGLSIEEQGCGVAEQLGDGLGGALN